MELITITKKEYERFVIDKVYDLPFRKGAGFSFKTIAPFVGMWKSRKDVKDAVGYIRKLRKAEDKRARRNL